MTNDRREEADRRNGTERRRGAGRRGLLLRLLKGERRQVEDRRRGWDGQAGVERRSKNQTATDLVRGAFDLMVAARGATDATLDDDTRQRLDSALIRLKFALERLTKEC
ncbi:MAG: hypothetical protein DMD29_04870 [Gemmatimonadetes bacterium]|nr:MAG: hypothetical protein DMD29_04870 [Gemmatimonadota bacterium]